MADNKNKGYRSNFIEEALDYGKKPPQAVDLEEAVLGAIMLEKDAIVSVMDILAPESFYKEDRKSVV